MQNFAMYNNTTNLTKQTNNTSDSSGINEKLAFQILNYIYIFILTIGCIGNILIIVYFINVNRRKLKKMSAYHFLLILLAIVDLIVVTTAISLKYQIHSIKLLQMFIYHCHNTFIWTSICILVIISFLRYKAIASPMKRRWSKKYYFSLCLICFCCCTCVWLIYSRYEANEKTNYITLIASRIVPLSMLCFFLIKMTNDLKKQTTIINDRTRNRNKIALNTVKYLIIIYFLTVVLVEFAEAITSIYYETFIKNDILSILMKIVFELYLINNVANVFVYAKFIKSFRRFLWNIITCRCMS